MMTATDKPDEVCPLELIDAWVARAEGFNVARRGERFVILVDDRERPVPTYTASEALARPIMEREGIEFQPYFADISDPLRVLAWAERPGAKLEPSVGDTEAEAGMLCYVALMFGKEPFNGASPVMS